MYSPKPNSNSSFLTNIEKLIINDDTIMRLLSHPPASWDESKQEPVPDPLEDDERLVICDKEGKYLDSKKYWDLAEDKFRKGSKRMQIEETKSAVLYMYEGRERPDFHNPYINTKEVTFRIVINEDFEIDNRISDISDRLAQLILHQRGIAGVSRIRLVGKNPREAPLGNRLQEDTYVYNVVAISGCC